MAEKKKETIVREATGPGPHYWTGSEPDLVDKAKSKISDVAGKAYDTMVKTFGAKGALSQPTIEGMKNPPEDNKPVKKAKGGKVAGKLATRGYGCVRK